MLAVGAMVALAALWIFALDHNNEYLFVLLPFALVLLGLGLGLG